MTVLVLVIQYAVGLVLLRAAIAKSVELNAFISTLSALRVPEKLLRPVSVLVIVLEASAAALLLSGQVPRAAGGLAGALTLGFVLVSLRAVYSDTSVPCSCFGGSHRNLGVETLIVSVPMLTDSVISAALASSANAEIRPVSLFGVLALALLLITAMQWGATLPTLIAIMRQRRVVMRDIVLASEIQRNAARG